MDYKDHQATFLEQYHSLNEEQRMAVEAIDGPVLVVAGPGTGKTQILAARIGNILLKTDSKPENILCLTFTDAATVAMRKRLLSFIGPDAHRIHIFTFHGFCNKVIQENQHLFGIRDLEPISDLEEIGLYKKLIDGFGKDNPLKRWTGNTYFEQGRLRGLFQIMKRENWTPSYIHSCIEEYIASLPTREEYIYKKGNSKQGYKKGDVKQKLIDAETNRMEELRAAATAFTEMENLMEESGRYTYDDMILWVLDRFSDPESDLLLRYQEQYHYFLVDEFQDTSGAQNDLLNRLTSYFDNPNVFVVGDDDQSIYRFQGASVENIVGFNQRYKEHVQSVVLTKNYRSTQQVLDAAADLIERNVERLVSDGTKKLVAQKEEVPVKPDVKVYENPVQEAADISKQIKELKDSTSLNEVAVIYRNHRQVETLISSLEEAEIPYNVVRDIDVLSTIFVDQLIRLLQYIAEEARRPNSREDLLFEVLHYDFFGLSSVELAALSASLRSKYGVKWRDFLSSQPKPTQATLFDQPSEPFDDVRKVMKKLEKWIARSFNTTSQQLFEEITVESGILGWIMKSSERNDLLQLLTTFFDFIKEQSRKKPTISLFEIVELVTEMRYNIIRLPIQKTINAEHGVNLLTAHGSKGLEFEKVFLLGADSATWNTKTRSRTYKLPDNLLLKLNTDTSDVEEQRRLFYVALTRAKQGLQISYASEDVNGKSLEPARFVSELIEGNKVDLEAPAKVDEEDLVQFQAAQFFVHDRPQLPLIDDEMLQPILDKYSMSVSHLSKYLRCPLRFYFENILRVPSAKNQYMAFGSAVHEALELFFRQTVDNDSKFPKVESLVSYFEKSMYKHRDSFTEKEYKQRLEYGQTFLPSYYNANIESWNPIVSIERRINQVVVDGRPINGVLDKIEFNGKRATVVDYKTGKYERVYKSRMFNPPDPEATEDDDYISQYGGDYWRQAVFYKILVDQHSSLDWVVEATTFDFVEPERKTGKFYQHPIEIKPEDIARVKQQIIQTYDAIMQKKFDTGCGEPDCHWCSFVESNYESMELQVTEEV